LAKGALSPLALAAVNALICCVCWANTFVRGSRQTIHNALISGYKLQP